MVKVGSYNIKDLDLIVATKSIEAFFQETSIDIEKTEDDVSMSKGLNGDVTFNESNDISYTLTFTVKADSEDHNYLLGLRASRTIFPVFYRNKTTGETMALSGCRFQKDATKSDGREMGGREWVIMIADGNNIT